MAADRPELVLLTADTVGGVWSYAVELARGLAQRGVRVALAVMGPPLDDARRREFAGLPGVTLHESRFALEWMRAPWADVERAGEWLLALESELRPDVVHLNQFAFGALPFAAPRLVVAHSCVRSWWRAVRGEPAPAEWERYAAVVAAGLRGADLVAAPTLAMLAALRAEYGFPTNGVVLPNGRDPARFPVGAKEPFVLSAGRLWDEAKNLGALEAVAGGLPWPVRVAGSAEHPDGGVRAAHGVEPLGVLDADAMADALGRAAIFALPARYEPFGLAVLEAALAGCALVLGDIPSLRELWGGAAEFVAPDDPDALRAALATLIGDDRRRALMAGLARTRALSFTTERMTDAYVAAYGAMLRSSRGRAARTAARAVRTPQPTEASACAS